MVTEAWNARQRVLELATGPCLACGHPNARHVLAWLIVQGRRALKVVCIDCVGVCREAFAEREGADVSSKVAGLLVVLETNVNKEEADFLCEAIRRLKGVLDATPTVEGDHVLQVAEKRVDALWREKLINLVKESL